MSTLTEKILNYFAAGKISGTHKAERLGKIISNMPPDRKEKVVSRLVELRNGVMKEQNMATGIQNKLNGGFASQFIRETGEFAGVGHLLKTGGVSYKNGKYYVIGPKGGIYGGPYETYAIAHKRELVLAKRQMKSRFVN